MLCGWEAAQVRHKGVVLRMETGSFPAIGAGAMRKCAVNRFVQRTRRVQARGVCA